MYINVPFILIIVVASAIAWFIGGCIGETRRNDPKAAWRGAWTGAVVGLIASLFATDQFQRSEINTREYEKASAMIARDCRLSTYATTILSDQTISRREYWGLQDRDEELGLGDAKSKINGEKHHQCPAA